MTDADPSFSDREVSLILRRAAEIEATGSGAPGMTEDEIEAIAREAGIRPGAVRLAIEELRMEPSRPARSWFVLPARRETRVVPTELGRDELASLMHAVEERAGRPGSVTEALGTVRWSSTEGLWTTHVSLTPRDGETRIVVNERLTDDRRKLFQILPLAWGGMAGMILAPAVAASPLGVIGLVAGGAAAGFGIGRALFGWRSAASGARVERLAMGLAEDARALAGDATRSPSGGQA